MNLFKVIILLLIFSFSFLSSAELSVASYNCGGLSEHYDYLRGAGMQKVMQERYQAEPELMALNERIQQVALTILFAPEGIEKELAVQEWEQKGYQKIVEQITKTPSEPNSPNVRWNQKVEQVITSYHVRPIVIHDCDVRDRVYTHIGDLTHNKKSSFSELLDETRSIMAKRIFSQFLKTDIICLQETDYLNPSCFPSNYEVVLFNDTHSQTGMAWNTDRLETVKILGTIPHALAVLLIDKETGKTLLIASGHLKGCNPFKVVDHDSSQGDQELQNIIDALDQQEADIKILGMDSNVTPLHPRLNILKNGDYQLDYTHFIESTCTNPYQVLNTRIDWIAVKSSETQAIITNIPVVNVVLNNLQTNISDHKPVAAKIQYN